MKQLLLFTLLVSSLFGGLINGIALVVNDEPITLLAIDTLAKSANVSKEDATKELVKQQVAKKMAKELNIIISDADVNGQIDMIMQKNNLTKESLKQQLVLTGMDYDSFFKQIKTQQMQQRIMQALTYEKVQEPSTEEQKEFYRLHKDEFAVPTTIEVTQYISPNPNSLNAIVKSPLFAPRDVNQQESEIVLAQINPQLAQLLLATKEGSYTQVLPLGPNQYGMFYIKRVGEKSVPSFEEVENKLASVIQNKKRQDIVEAAYQAAILKADIEYIRVSPLKQ